MASSVDEDHRGDRPDLHRHRRIHCSRPDRVRHSEHHRIGPFRLARRGGSDDHAVRDNLAATGRRDRVRATGWAQTGTLWLVYPEGMECKGPEGCPNSFTHLIGTPSDPLPEGVVYYDPACHDGWMVWPKEQSPYMTEGNTMRLDGPITSAPDSPPSPPAACS